MRSFPKELSNKDTITRNADFFKIKLHAYKEAGIEGESC